MIFVPNFAKGKTGFKIPFGYGFVSKSITDFGSYYEKFPLNLILRLKLKYETQKKTHG